MIVFDIVLIMSSGKDNKIYQSVKINGRRSLIERIIQEFDERGYGMKSFSYNLRP